MEKISKKAVIIGCSIAGSTTALLLSKAGMQVKVFEQKPESEMGEKVCANIVTSSFLNQLKELEINPEDFTNKKFSAAEFYSQKNSVEIPVEDYEIDRKKLTEEIVRKARNKGAQFFFSSKFLGFEKSRKGYNVILENKENNKIAAEADYIIGADGALSEVAKKAKLFGRRKFWLAIQAKIPLKGLKEIEEEFDFEKYCVFFIPKMGYYSYIFPSKEFFVVGTVAKPETATEMFGRFAGYLKIKEYSIESALIPVPKKIKFRKGNIFLIGDAACQTKFTGGGIVPAIKGAFAILDIIRNKKTDRINELNKEIGIHKLIARFLSRMNEKDFDKLFDIAKKSKIPKHSRDELRKWAKKFMLSNPSLIRFLQKLL